MKKYFLLLLISVSLTTFAQEEGKKETKSEQKDDNKDYQGKNEIKINIGYFIAGYPQISFERVLNKESALGISVEFRIDEEVPFKYGILPYYRFYFGKKPAAGFFFEAVGAFYSQEKTITTTTYYGHPNYNINYQERIESQQAVGFGAALGGKFMTKKGWTGEIFGGVLRSKILTDNSTDFYPRAGLSIGKRF